MATLSKVDAENICALLRAFCALSRDARWRVYKQMDLFRAAQIEDIEIAATKNLARALVKEDV